MSLLHFDVFSSSARRVLFDDIAEPVPPHNSVFDVADEALDTVYGEM